MLYGHAHNLQIVAFKCVSTNDLTIVSYIYNVMAIKPYIYDTFSKLRYHCLQYNLAFWCLEQLKWTIHILLVIQLKASYVKLVS